MGYLLKNKKSLKSRMIYFLLEAIFVFIFFYVLYTGLYLARQIEYEENVHRMYLLSMYYSNLEKMNQETYLYALEGEEKIYRELTDLCLENRGYLKELVSLNIGTDFYRDIRDVEETFRDYMECINKIYEHSYLCMAVTIESKNVINRYYNDSQKRYEAMNNRFQSLYQQLESEAELRNKVLEKKNLSYLIITFILFVVILFNEGKQVRKLWQKIIRPVQELTENAELVGNSDLQLVHGVVENKGYDNEMKNLVSVYNSMLKRIQLQVQMMQENADMKEKLQKKEMENLKISNLLKSSELKALQMQINPHFLFNTLNMISQTAYMENAEETRELLNTTGRLLRYTLDYSGHTVTLGKEMEMLGSYVEIQENRFGGRIQFLFDLDERFHKTEMPSMILQPLVENTITHGLGMMVSGGEVEIKTRYCETEKCGMIEVIDNGEGMSAEKLEELRKRIEQGEDNSKTIGLNNVYRRLKLFYGERVKMEIESEEHKGTIIRILLFDCVFAGGKNAKDNCC